MSSGAAATTEREATHDVVLQLGPRCRSRLCLRDPQCDVARAHRGRRRPPDLTRQSCPQTRKSIGESRSTMILYLVAGGCGATAYGGDPMESIWTPERITQLSQH